MVDNIYGMLYFETIDDVRLSLRFIRYAAFVRRLGYNEAEDGAA